MDKELADYRVSSEQELDSLYGAPLQISLDIELDFLDPHLQMLVEKCRLVCLATESGDGVDTTPRGGEAGFVLVLDKRTIAIPDFPGNNKISALRNIVRTARAGTLFLFPGTNYFMRVNGPAHLNTSPALLKRMAHKGKTPKLAVVIEVEEAFFHCGKALMRSEIWDPESWPARDVMPRAARMLIDWGKVKDMTEDEMAEYVDTTYRATLY